MLTTLSKTNLKTYWGIQEEDSKIAGLFTSTSLYWCGPPAIYHDLVTTPALTCLGADSKASETITKSFKTHMAGITTQKVVSPSDDPAIAFNAPVTEAIAWVFPSL